MVASPLSSPAATALESEMVVPVLVALEVAAPARVVLLLAVLVDRPLVLVVVLHW